MPPTKEEFAMPTSIRRPTGSRKSGLIVIALTGVILAGCSGGDNDPNSSGGVLTVANGPGVTCLDPQQLFASNAAAVTRTIVDSLTDQDPETGEIVPWLAESWEVNEDATEYTFNLRQDVTYSDGTAFDAENLQANIDYVQSLEALASRGSTYLSSYLETTVDDEFTATVKFSEPAAQFLIGTATLAFGMLSDDTIAKTPEERCQGDLVGTGPFTLESYAQDQSASVLRRDDYAWPSELAENTSPAHLERIDFEFQALPNVRAGAVVSGQVDVAMAIESQDIGRIEGAGNSILVGTRPGMPGSLFINPLRPVTSDPAVREAMLIGFERSDIVATVLGDYFAPATSVFTTNLLGYTDLSDQLSFDPERASSVLDSAGWVLGSDGVRSKDGQQLSVTLTYTEDDGPFLTSLLQLVQQQLNEIGFDIVLDTLPTATLLERLQAGDFDAMVGSQTEADPTFARSRMELLIPPDDQTESGLAPLFAAEQGIADPDERAEVFREIQEIVVAGGYVIPIYEDAQLTAISESVTGLRNDSNARLTFYDTALVR